MNLILRLSPYCALVVAAACADNATTPSDQSAPLLAKVAPAPVLLPLIPFGNLTISSSALASPAPAQDGSIGPQIFSLPGRSLAGTVSDAGDGCDGADFTGFTAGNIAIVERGICTFSLKATNAANAGAIGIIVYQSVFLGDQLTGMGGTPVSIPAVFVGRTAGLLLVGAAPVGVTIAWDPFTPLAGAIGQMATAGAINGGEANSLSVKLLNAKAKADNGQDAVAINMLNAFINEVQAMAKTKRIAEQDGLILANTAQAVINLLTP